MLPFELTKDTPYLALSGELWSVFYEYFNRNWSCYKGFLLYEVTYPVPNYNGATNFAHSLLGIWLLSILRKLICVSKRGPWDPFY